MGVRQLQLDIEQHWDAKISDFSGPGWLPVIDRVRQLHAGLIKNLYIYGAAGTGKSRLLSAICDAYLDSGKSAIQVSLLELVGAPIEAIQTLENFELVLLDDIETIKDADLWQKAICSLIDLSDENGYGQLVFSARKPPTALNLRFLDLRSRLAQAVSVQVPSGEDLRDRQALLNALMLRRSIQFDEGIQAYLLKHGAKQPSALLKTIEHIEDLLKGETKRLTQTKRKQIFGLIDEYCR